MKLGLSTLMFPDSNPLDGVEIAQEQGFGHVEVMLEAPYFSSDPDSGKLDKLGERIESYGLEVRVHCYFTDLNPSSPYRELREVSLRQAKKSIEAAETLGGDVVTFHPGRCWNSEKEDLRLECEDRFVSYLDEITSFADRRNVTLGLETGSHSADLPRPSEGLLGFIEGRENLGITVDIGHLFLLARDNAKNVKKEEWMADLIEIWGEEIVNVHAHDNNGWIDQHLPPGQGSIDYEALMDPLRRAYDGPFILELWKPAELSTALSTGLKFLEQF